MAAGYIVKGIKKANKELVEKANKELEEFRKENEKKAENKSAHGGAVAGILTALPYAYSQKATENSNSAISKYSSGFSPSKNLSAIKGQADAAAEAVKLYPTFTYDRQNLLDEALEAYRTRDDFKYDVNADALYKQYEDKYLEGGRLAMQDAMGQAQAATGGYGNSYAATVGNQAYQSHVQGLTDIIPDLEQLAYSKYNREGEDLYNKYALLADDRKTAYGEYLDGYQKALADRDYYASQYSNEYNREYGEWSDKKIFDYNKYWDETKFEYEKSLNALATMSEALSELRGGNSASSSGDSVGNEEQIKQRKQILDKIANTLSSSAFQYDGEAAKEYINGLVYSGTITTEEASYLWNMSGVGALTGAQYVVPSAQSVASKKFLNNTSSNDDYSRNNANVNTVEREIIRQYDQGLLTEKEVELLLNYYQIIG